MAIESHELKALAIELAAAMPPASVVPRPAQPGSKISVGDVDLIGEKLRKALGILDLMRSCGDADADVPASTLSATAWAAQGMVREALETLEVR